ncbi:hypothetical protein NIES4103_36150 [Nostoc sp. NIES-4103]|nr:hypothetical protein NIES4103_36150 [Nostoc sp. NIES-4103]
MKFFYSKTFKFIVKILQLATDINIFYVSFSETICSIYVVYGYYNHDQQALNNLYLKGSL